MTDTVAPSVVERRLATWSYIVQALISGLQGQGFSWSAGEVKAYRPKAKALGFTLVTKTGAKNLGYRIKEGVKPVGNGYFLAPISGFADLYILECQTVKVGLGESHSDSILTKE